MPWNYWIKIINTVICLTKPWEHGTKAIYSIRLVYITHEKNGKNIQVGNFNKCTTFIKYMLTILTFSSVSLKIKHWTLFSFRFHVLNVKWLCRIHLYIYSKSKSKQKTVQRKSHLIQILFEQWDAFLLCWEKKKTEKMLRAIQQQVLFVVMKRCLIERNHWFTHFILQFIQNSDPTKNYKENQIKLHLWFEEKNRQKKRGRKKNHQNNRVRTWNVKIIIQKKRKRLKWAASFVSKGSSFI